MNKRQLVENLYDDAFVGKDIDPELVRRVIEQFDRSDIGLYRDILWVIGRAELTEFWKFVDRALHSKQPPIVEAAINTIFGQWTSGEQGRYVATLRSYAEGPDWDDDTVRLKALSRLGSYLQGHEDDEILAYLFNVAQDERAPGLVREAAYRGLALGLGRKYSELPGGPGHSPYENDGWKLFDEAKSRLRSS